jgi:hypothetical protein
MRMEQTSIGPAQSLPASDTKERAAIENVDAQRANETDTRHGEAGAEAKPFARARESHDTPHRPGDSEMPRDEPNDMISGRRNAGRDDTGYAPQRPTQPNE